MSVKSAIYTEMRDKNAISPEKKAQYALIKKERERSLREQRRLEQESGRTGERRMAFLVNIFKSLGYTQEEFSHATGVSSQMLSWYISVSDDCQLSKVYSMLRSVGVKASVGLEKPKAPPVREVRWTGTGVRCRIEGTLPVQQAGQDYPRYLTECGPESRLWFLREFIESTNMGASAFAKTCGLDPSSLRYYFNRDDIKISAIYKIALSLGADIVWTINPAEG